MNDRFLERRHSLPFLIQSIFQGKIHEPSELTSHESLHRIRFLGPLSIEIHSQDLYSIRQNLIMSFSLKSHFCLGLENTEKFEDSFGPTSVFLSFIMILRSLPRLIKSEPPEHSVLASVFQEGLLQFSQKQEPLVSILLTTLSEDSIIPLKSAVSLLPSWIPVSSLHQYLHNIEPCSHSKRENHPIFTRKQHCPIDIPLLRPLGDRVEVGRRIDPTTPGGAESFPQGYAGRCSGTDRELRM